MGNDLDTLDHFVGGTGQVNITTAVIYKMLSSKIDRRRCHLKLSFCALSEIRHGPDHILYIFAILNKRFIFLNKTGIFDHV